MGDIRGVVNVMKKQWDDQSAVNNIRAGKQEGATYLYNEYGGRLRGFFKKWVNGLSDEDAEDILQNTFIRFINHVQKELPENMRVYLFTIGKNECYRFLDKNQTLSIQKSTPSKRNNDDDDMDDNSGEGTELASGVDLEKEIAFQECFAKGLKTFEKHEKNAQACLSILTLVFKGWSLKDIADKKGKTHGAIREFFSQCRKKLKHYVEDCFSQRRR
jgi:RNA polymerase sigma factor (sigma-70 family)